MCLARGGRALPRPTSLPMQAGLLIADRFLIRSQLGRGGMGSVWLAHHTQLDVPCAVKFIEGPNSRDPELRRRFTQEAKAAALLRSPHVVQIFDAGTWEGTPYLAMELLEGEELSKRLERAGRLDAATCVAFAEQMARALGKAHAAGIVHRDLKPDNIFLVRDEGREFVKILDFGIAKRTSASLESASKQAATKDGAFLGTPYYMSPEQTRDSRGVDYRADLWSLAVIVFECATGRRPFQSEVLTDLLLKISFDPLPVPSEVAPGLPPAFDAWWARAAVRDPAKRFASAREMADALAAALGVSADPVVASAPGAASRPPPGAGGGDPFASTTGGSSLALATSPRSSVAPARSRRRVALVSALGAIGAIAGAALLASGVLRRAEGASGASAAALAPEPPRASASPGAGGGGAPEGAAPERAPEVVPAAPVAASAGAPRASASAAGGRRPRPERPAKKPNAGGGDDELGF